MANGYLYVFNLSNRQEQYAQCLRFIEILEGDMSDKGQTWQFQTIKELVKELKIFGGPAPTDAIAKRYFEVPLTPSDATGKQTQDIFPLREAQERRVQTEILEHAGENIYHLRIHFSYNEKCEILDLMELRYLALLLQRLRKLINEKYAAGSRISVFIVPASGEKYPFEGNDGVVDTQTYKTVSAYLRLVSRAYAGTIYGVGTEKGKPEVLSLDFKITAPFSRDFPLVQIEEDTYEKLFVRSVLKEDFVELLRLKKRRRFRNAADMRPEIAFSDYLMEASIGALKSAFEPLGTEQQQWLEEVIGRLLFSKRSGAEGQFSIMAFALFCFMCRGVQVNNGQMETIARDLADTRRRAVDLAGGLRQIAQNALQHSPTKRGVFSFAIQDSEEDGNKQRILLAMCDYNNQETFADTFIGELKKERDAEQGWAKRGQRSSELLKVYDGLIAVRQEIRLENFFMKYDDSEEVKDAWKKFRQADLYAHVGLILFAAVIRRCRGSILAVNSPSGIMEKKCYYYESPDHEEAPVLPQMAIPGTQFLIEIPNTPLISLTDETILGLAQLNYFRVGYSDFAHYFPFQFKRCKYLGPAGKAPEVSCTDADKKRAMVRSWREEWIASAHRAKRNVEEADCKAGEDQIIFVWDMDAQTVKPISTDDNEVYWKGFVEALDILRQDGFRYIAVTNLSLKQIAVFRELCMAYVLKSFPGGVQVYIAQKLDETSDFTTFHLMGKSYAQAIQNAYCLATERGTKAFDNYELERVQAMCPGVLTKKDTQENISVCPFDAILPCVYQDIGTGLEEPVSLPTLFDRQVELMAESPIDKEPYGYKIGNTHMQLGSKVHIHAFYEMAYLFYRTSIANRIAFEILRELEKCKNIDIQNDKIMFYGYASYSKALLTALLEILKCYRANALERLGVSPEVAQDLAGQDLALATYQHNLQSESTLPKVELNGAHKHISAGQEKIQLYFDFSSSTETENREKAFFSSQAKLIQIVPISSTLTTFEKMFARLKREFQSRKLELNEAMQLCANFTAFWVTDAAQDIRAGRFSEIELNYIKAQSKATLKKNRYIMTRFKTLEGCPDIHFLMLDAAVWEMPLTCKKCYPKNLIAEVPLVGVDQTSTVPTQQIRPKEGVGEERDKKDNNTRLLKLMPCVWKGHILREKNHFSYYIDTQRFFTSARHEVADWLEGLAKKRSTRVSSTPLNIIFSPEHTTNIGFAQYVNNYYFGGNAEIVCLNEDKEFRSNFRCEHMALYQAINRVFALYGGVRGCNTDDLPVKFYFVDDTIISGTTFHKANSFLNSLLPKEIRRLYPTNLIEQCFVLVDRLSSSSKENYVRNVKEDFHSFVHLDISNSRTQGDSCVGCKRVQSAVQLFKRSSTRRHAEHWFRTINHNAICAYDDSVTYDHKAGQNPDWKDPGRKMLLSHIAQNMIFQENDFFEPGAIYDSILDILSQICHTERPKQDFQYGELIKKFAQNMALWVCVSDLLNLLARPFFSYDFKCRFQVQTMLIIFAQCLLNGRDATTKSLEKLKTSLEAADNYKEFLFEEKRIERTMQICEAVEKDLKNGENKLKFLDECIFSGLAELQSTYLIRKATFASVYHFVAHIDKYEYRVLDEFFAHYAANIHFLLDSGNDETRCVWMENLLLTGEEYTGSPAGRDETTWHSLYETIVGQKWEVASNMIAAASEAMVNSLFARFCDEIFLQNTRIIYDGIEDIQTSPDGRSRFTEPWKLFRSIDGFDALPSKSETQFFTALENHEQDTEYSMDVKKKYGRVLQTIQAVAEEKYHFSDVKMALLTCTEANSEVADSECKIQQLDFVASGTTVPKKDSWTRYQIKSKLLKALNKREAGNQQCVLLEYGYQFSGGLSEGRAQEAPYAFVYFDNPQEPIDPAVTVSVGTSVGRETKKIVKVFLYFSADPGKKDQPGSSHQLMLRLFLRDVLVYRHRIMKLLENDFAGDTFTKYAHTANERNILAHEKVNSHNTSSDDRTSLDVLAQPKTAAQYEVLDSAQITKWLLLRNYINGQIAKLFNRSFSKRDEDGVFDRGDSSIQPPPLYIGKKSTPRELGGEPDRPLIYFYQLGILDDARFVLLEQAVSIVYDSDLEKAEFIQNAKNGEYYNSEYMKCILIDIIFSAMKFASDRENFLPRLDRCLKKMHLHRHQGAEGQMSTGGEGIADSICAIKISREVTGEEYGYDYLVITNAVDYKAHNLFDIEMSNQHIRAHLESPTDFFDGHMSLLAIKEYIEGLCEDDKRDGEHKAVFQYEVKEESQEGEEVKRKNVCFVSKLPILKKEGD